MPAYDDVSHFSSCDEPEIIHQCSDSCLHVFQHEAYRSVSYCAVVRSSSRQKPIQNNAFSFFPSSKLSRILRKLRAHLFAFVLPSYLPCCCGCAPGGATLPGSFGERVHDEGACASAAVALFGHAAAHSKRHLVFQLSLSSEY